MSRRKRRVVPQQNPVEPSRPNTLLWAIAATVVLAGVPFALGKYVELNSPDPFDGGAYVYSAQRVLNGARLWVDEIPSAQPGTMLCNIVGVALFGFSDLGPNLIQMLLQVGGFAMLFYTVRRLFGNLAAVVSTSLAAIMLSAPVIAKYGNVKEQFMIPFAIVAACAFALHETGRKKRWAIVAGAAAVIPYYFKATGIAVVVAIGVYLIVKLLTARRDWKTVFGTLGLLIVGAAVGLLFPASLYVWQGNIAAFWTTFPVVLLRSVLLFSALAFGVLAAMGHIPWKRAITALGAVDRKLWKFGAGAIFASLLLSITLIAATRGSDVKHDIPSYFRSIPLIRIPTQGWLFLNAQLNRLVVVSGLKEQGGYVGLSRQVRSFAEQAPQVNRYYNAAGTVVYPALAALLLAAALWLWRLLKKQKAEEPLHGVAGFLALWWVIDMALVWISPHSYEQYYLPLCASGAMLVAYAAWCWSIWLKRSTNKIPAFAAAAASVFILLILVFPVFAGFARSPDTGSEYKNARTGQPERRRGYVQSLQNVGGRNPAPWQAVADHVRAKSTPDDTLYVWGWLPGIYVRAQRMAPVPRAYEGDMHITPPTVFGRKIDALLERFQEQPPRFIIDGLKRHFPFDRPPFELWPILPPNTFGNPKPRLLADDPREIQAFEAAHAAQLRRQFGEDEALRFEAMKPFRDFVRTRYRFAGQFGAHMLFERID